MLKEKRQMEATRKTVEVANPIRDKEIERDKKAAVIGTRLSYRETSQPEMGNPTIELIGMNNKMVPSSASL